MQNIYFLITVTFCTFLLTSCNTIKGAGEDIQHAGRGIEKVAKKTGAD